MLCVCRGDQGQGARRRLAMACSIFTRRPGPNPPSRAAGGFRASPCGAADCNAGSAGAMLMRTSQKLWYCAITAHASPVALLTLCPWWQWAMGRPGFKHMPWAPVLVAGLAAFAVALRRELGCTCGSCWVCGARAGSFKPRHTWLIFPAFATCNVFAIMMVTKPQDDGVKVVVWCCSHCIPPAAGQ